MGEITIIRHGQANVGARDEAEYDRLSELGHQQAAWSGEYFTSIDKHDHLIHGTMRRHIETANGANPMVIDVGSDPRFNEMEYFKLANACCADYGLAFPKHETEFPAFMQKILTHWDELAARHNLESYGEFEARILDGLKHALNAGEHVLIVSSGGVIATLANIATKVSSDERWRLFAGVAHTSQHRFKMTRHGLELAQYGAIPHLERKDRRHAITYV